MLNINLLSGKHFNAEEGECLLDAAIKSGLAIAYSCRTGRCGVCKCKVINGLTNALYSEAGLTDEERLAGWVLSCVREVKTDLDVEMEGLGVQLPLVKTFPCRISGIERVASDVLRVTLRLPPAADFAYLPGQYIDIIGPEGHRRSYSIANAGFGYGLIELHIRAIPNGIMSQYWVKRAQINDLLRLNGPLGTFFLRDTTFFDLIFLATGTGIAPVKAILESIVHIPPENQPKSVTVLWGRRSQEDLYFDFEMLPANYRYIPVLSRAGGDWVGAKGYVQDALLDMKPDLSHAAIYACGSGDMIRSARARLLQAGLSHQRFYSDSFVCSGN